MRKAKMEANEKLVRNSNAVMAVVATGGGALAEATETFTSDKGFSEKTRLQSNRAVKSRLSLILFLATIDYHGGLPIAL